jgi:trimethylamine--corrinoid protein Co-methyltransferase
LSSPPLFRLLAPEALTAILDAAFATLAKVGVRVEGDAARALLRERGADERDGRLRISEGSARAALATVPARFALFDRDGAVAVRFGEGGTAFDPGSAAIHLLDRASGERRPATTADLVELARLVDALPHFAAQSTSLVPSDVPESLADRWRLSVALRHGRKPVVTGTFRADGFAPMRAMLAVVRGGETALRERPLALFDCCPTSPLTWSALTAQALVDAARAGVPANLVAVPMTGATAPVTLSGALAQLAAENLAGVAIHQAAASGAPLVWGGAPSAFDMRQGTAAMGAVESAMLNAANAEIGRSLGLPTHGYLALSDAKTPDYQAGAESAAGALLGALAGIDLVSGPGLVDLLLTFSLEKLVLDHDACGAALRLARGIAPHAGDLVGLIGELAATGELLSHPHTRAHWRAELALAGPTVDRGSYGDWQAAGARSAAARAGDQVARLLARASDAPPLDDEVARELDAIVAAEARRAGVAALPAI